MSIVVDRLSVMEPDPHWPVQFNSDAQKVSKLLGGILVSLDHIGATSIMGLAATPRLDILAQVSSMDHFTPLIETLTQAGFAPMTHLFTLRSKIFIVKSQHPPVCLWVYEAGDPQALKMLKFRNFMRSEKKINAFFSRAKKNLIDKYKGNLHEYLQHRSALFQAVDIKALHTALQPGTCLPSNMMHFYPKEKTTLNEWALDNFYFFLHWSWLYTQKAHCIRSANISYTIASDSSDENAEQINTIFGVSNQGGDLTLLIEEIKKLFQERRAPCTWWVTQRDKPTDLFKKIHREGFIYEETVNLLTLDLTDSKAPYLPELSGAQISKVARKEQMVQYCNCLQSSFISEIARGAIPNPTKRTSEQNLHSTQPLIAFGSLAELSYAGGQNMEFVTLSRKGTVQAVVTLIYYASFVGIYNWSYVEGAQQELITLIQTQIVRATQKNWKAFAILTSEKQAPIFNNLGFVPTHPIHRHYLPPAPQSPSSF